MSTFNASRLITKIQPGGRIPADYAGEDFGRVREDGKTWIYDIAGATEQAFRDFVETAWASDFGVSFEHDGFWTTVHPCASE